MSYCRHICHTLKLTCEEKQMLIQCINFVINIRTLFFVLLLKCRNNGKILLFAVFFLFSQFYWEEKYKRRFFLHENKFYNVSSLPFLKKHTTDGRYETLFNFATFQSTPKNLEAFIKNIVQFFCLLVTDLNLCLTPTHVHN